MVRHDANKCLFIPDRAQRLSKERIPPESKQGEPTGLLGLHSERELGLQGCR